MIILSALLIYRRAWTYYDQRLECYKETLTLLTVIKERMSTTSMRLCDILGEIRSLSFMQTCGFIEKAKSDGLYRAFISHKKLFTLDDRDKSILCDYFRNAGKNLLGEEIKNISDTIEHFQRKYNELKISIPKSKKVCVAVIICSFSLITVLFI